MNDGIYNIPAAEYHRIQRVSQSVLSQFSKTPAHARESLLHPPEPSPAMRLGTGGHAAILEPSTFDQRYVCGPRVDRRSKAGRDEWTAFEAKHANAEILSVTEMEACRGMAAGIARHELASKLVAAPGKREVSILATIDDVPCKGRIDLLCSFMGWTVIGDLKTTKSAATRDFAKSVAEYGYHIQAAFYLDLLAALAPADRRYWIIAVESSPPYEAQVFELADAAVEQGRREYKAALAAHQRCVKTGIWPGYGGGLTPLELPRWRRDADYEGSCDED